LAGASSIRAHSLLQKHTPKHQQQIGRELLDARAVGEYGIEEGLSYDVTAWQNQTSLGAQVVASLLLVDSRPGKMLPEQNLYADECREKEVPCYANLS